MYKNIRVNLGMNNADTKLIFCDIRSIFNNFILYFISIFSVITFTLQISLVKNIIVNFLFRSDRYSISPPSPPPTLSLSSHRKNRNIKMDFKNLFYT